MSDEFAKTVVLGRLPSQKDEADIQPERREPTKPGATPEQKREDSDAPALEYPTFEDTSWLT